MRIVAIDVGGVFYGINPDQVTYVEPAPIGSMIHLVDGTYITVTEKPEEVVRKLVGPS